MALSLDLKMSVVTSPGLVVRRSRLSATYRTALGFVVSVFMPNS